MNSGTDAGVPVIPPSADASVPALTDGGAAVSMDAAAPVSPSDLGAQASPDMATGMHEVGGAGPWPAVDLTFYSGGSGLAGNIIDTGPDDGQNIWAASRDTLFVLHPGQSRFAKYTAADGLHIQSFTDPDNHQNTTFITAIAGGRANEVFVGYYGYETYGDPFMDTQAQKELGNGDRVTVDGNGKLATVRYLFRCDYEANNGCWEDRSPRRILYAHDGVAAGHVFFGFNHGVSHVFNDVFGDHVHPEVWYQPGNIEKLGEFYGLAVTPSGDLWLAGRYGVGLQPWNAQPHFAWVDGHFKFAFTTNTADHGLDVPLGYREDNRGAAVTPDGTLWLARASTGLASWDPKSAGYTTIKKWAQPPSDLLDVQADPDGTLWLVTSGGALLRFNPANTALTTVNGVSNVNRIYLDTRVSPRAVYAATAGGVAVIRSK